MVKRAGRPRLLFVCLLNPWRLNNGGIIRNYWLVRALAERFDLDLVTADEVDGVVPPDFAARCNEIVCFPRPKNLQAKLARATGALRPDGTYFTSGSVTRQMQTAVADLVRTRTYSAIVTELGMIDAVPHGNVPVVYSAHNCEAALMLRRAKLEPIWSRIPMTIDALRLRRLEARLIERAVIVTPCSQNDVVDMQQFAPSIDRKAVVIPNGVDCATYEHVAPLSGKDGVILVTGSFDWLPNRRGLMWFIAEVLPILETLLAGSGFSVRVAGRMSAEFAKKLGELSPRITAVPNVPRMDVELGGASVVAVPVIASSGTRLRILEAWAAGRPIVTTPHGAFGLDYSDGVDIFSCPTPQRFAEATVTLLSDAALRSKLRNAGIARAATYDWSAIGSKLIAAFERVGILSPMVRQELPVQAEI